MEMIFLETGILYEDMKLRVTPGMSQKINEKFRATYKNRIQRRGKEIYGNRGLPHRS